MKIFNDKVTRMAPKLDVRHLKMLVEIDRCGSVTNAAEVIGLTQSALTHRIREAERRLGLALYTRVGKGLRMTPAGEMLAQTAARLLDELERTERDAMEAAFGVEHVVRVGLGTYTRYHWLPAFLTYLRAAEPGLEVEVIADAAQRPLAMLIEGAIDVAIVAPGERPGGLGWIRLFTDELVAISPVDHRFAAAGHIEAEEMRDEVWITYGMKTEPGFEGERFMRPADTHPKRVVRVELPEAIVELVRAGLGVSILTRWAVAPHLDAGLLAATRLTKAGLPIEWVAAVRNADDAASPSHRLANALAAWCASPGGGFQQGADSRR